MKEIFFNLQGGKGHNIGLTCNFAELIDGFFKLRRRKMSSRSWRLVVVGLSVMLVGEEQKEK